MAVIGLAFGKSSFIESVVGLRNLSSSGANSPSPLPSPRGEGTAERRRQSSANRVRFADRLATILPLPLGEGENFPNSFAHGNPEPCAARGPAASPLLEERGWGEVELLPVHGEGSPSSVYCGGWRVRGTGVSTIPRTSEFRNWLSSNFVQINAGQPPAPTGQNVVGDGVLQLGDFVDGDFVAALVAHDDGFVPELDSRNVGDVHGHGVHGDAADERSALAIKITQPKIADARESVAIADRQHRDAARRGGRIAHAIADAVAGLERLDGGHAGLDGHDGFDAGDAAADRRGIDAELEDPDADHVEMSLRQIQKAAAVAEVAEFQSQAGAGNVAQGFLEVRELRQRKSLFGLIGLGEVAQRPPSRKIVLVEAMASTSEAVRSQRTPYRFMPVLS